jgi:hypothetical protein
MTKPTRIDPNPDPFYHIIFAHNSIVPNQPQPDFDLKRQSSFPHMFSRNVNTNRGKLPVHELNSKLSILSFFYFGTPGPAPCVSSVQKMEAGIGPSPSAKNIP